MYKLQVQYSVVPLAEPSSPTIIALEEHLACPWCGFFFCDGCCSATAPVLYYQGMQQGQLPVSSGPSRNRNTTEFRQAEPQYPNHSTHASSGAILEDGSIGFHPGQDWIGADDYTGGEQKQENPYDRVQVQAQWDRADCDHATWDYHSYEVPSMFQVPITVTDSDPLAQGGSTSTTYRKRSERWMHRTSTFEVPMSDLGLGSGGAIAGASNISTPAAPSESGSTSISVEPISTASVYTKTRTSTTGRDTVGQERHGAIELEEDDFDTVSLGSE